MANWKEATNAWREIVGDDHVSTDRRSLAAAETATFATSQRIPALVRPASRSEVQACLKVANRFGTPIYPVSAGKNWGLGSRVPAAADCALLDLGRMRAISDFDEDLAHVTVEPGVTFGQLYDFLKSRRSRLFANTTGASPHASVVGNALERGDGTGPYGDRWAHVCALEVVLPTGECLHTGFDRWEGTPLAPLHRWGVGPTVDGLFCQSSLGVVTKMTLWLQPLPRSLTAITFSVVDPARLVGLVDALRSLKLDGSIRSVVGIWNDYRVLSTRGGYPWDLTGGRVPLGRDALDEIKHEWGGARWFGLTAIYAPSAGVGKAVRAHVRDVLGPRTDLLHFEERTGEPTSGHELFVEDDPGFLFLQGIPHEGSLRSVYWRKRGGVPDDLDPDRDGCGVLWVCPAVPLAGDHVARSVEVAEISMLERGFEPLIVLVSQTERTAYLIPLIVYDRAADGADEAAMGCHDELLRQYVHLGYLPHRLGIQSMGALPPPRDDYVHFLATLKRTLDPNDVVSPGRYDFRALWPPKDGE